MKTLQKIISALSVVLIVVFAIVSTISLIRSFNVSLNPSSSLFLKTYTEGVSFFTGEYFLLLGLLGASALMISEAVKNANVERKKTGRMILLGATLYLTVLQMSYIIGYTAGFVADVIR